jgi:dipeptidyl aminopeptidase/acylaminoacyl peptidase
LIYGNVDCQEIGTCAIHKIEVSTGRITMVPGSEGKGTARWSPDGRFVAALYPERQQVHLLDLAKGRWRMLAAGVNGDDLSWAADSRYVYASRPTGDKPEVLRISVTDGKMEPAVDLSDFGKMAGKVGTWFALTPEGSIIFMRSLDQSDVYSLHYHEM